MRKVIWHLLGSFCVKEAYCNHFLFVDVCILLYNKHCNTIWWYYNEDVFKLYFIGNSVTVWKTMYMIYIYIYSLHKAINVSYLLIANRSKQIFEAGDSATRGQAARVIQDAVWCTEHLSILGHPDASFAKNTSTVEPNCLLLARVGLAHPFAFWQSLRRRQPPIIDIWWIYTTVHPQILLYVSINWFAHLSIFIYLHYIYHTHQTISVSIWHTFITDKCGSLRFRGLPVDAN